MLFRSESGSSEDVLISNVFQSSKIPSLLSSTMRILSEACYAAFKNGILSYCLFAILGLALSSVIGLSRISNWRLMNATYVLCGFILIIVINTVLYSGIIYNKINISITVQKWLPIAINGVIFLVFTLIGILNLVNKENPNREVVL